MHKGMNDARKTKSSEEIFKKKGKFKGNTLQDIKISCVAIVIKTLWYWYKVKSKRSIVTEKRSQNPAHTYTSLAFP